MKKEIKKGEIIIYKTSDGPNLDVRLDKETVWLTQNQIAILFDTQRPAITKHLNNIFESKELDKNSVSSILEHTASDGKKYKTQFYSLDAIISVGYRVNSKRATQFRVWATRTLKNYLVKGYAVNEKRLLEAENKFNELQTTVDFLRQKSKYELMTDQEQEILNLLGDYAKTLTLLGQYDNEKVVLSKKGKGKFALDHPEAIRVIQEIKKDLASRQEASDFFGTDAQGKLQGILGNILQTFDKKELYPSIEEKAAHLLYFIIKDHPFIDGNKRIASFLFVYFLDRNRYLYKENGEKKINDNALTALTLLMAISDPREKDKLIKIVTNLLSA
ncbi:MAG: virulence protein RhuM/Fic/DOC family protein [Candidatus Parcubacteria bacterium]|nr:virulence protein RhuM/Fic/DOC family protein [Candidatus Parcubacteria bacterium]